MINICGDFFRGKATPLDSKASSLMEHESENAGNFCGRVFPVSSCFYLSPFEVCDFGGHFFIFAGVL